eukprot:275946-Pyramimonas_sp.AAC.1
MERTGQNGADRPARAHTTSWSAKNSNGSARFSGTGVSIGAPVTQLSTAQKGVRFTTAARFRC